MWLSLRRALTGKLRIGLAAQTVLAALAQAAVLTPPAVGKFAALLRVRDAAVATVTAAGCIPVRVAFLNRVTSFLSII